MKLKTVMMHVGEDHLENGDPGLNASCAVSLALQAMLTPPERQFHPVGVYENDIVYVGLGVKGATVPHSKRLHDYIKRIDAKESVSPTSFRVQVPEAWLKIVS